MTLSDDIKNLFFLGIGGIGMSALARYFQSVERRRIYGYDRTPSELTRELEAEGMSISYDDSVRWLNSLPLNPQNTLVVRTPAVPEDSVIYTELRREGFQILKRSEVLGIVTRQKKALCVAGTHGKTTTSTMLAHLMQCNAFLGGISMNYHTNVLIHPESDYAVVEADEYDRSFHQLTPYISVVTAVDPDHLDIYGTPEAYRDAFAHYTSLITGALVMKQGLELKPRLQKGVKCYTYGVVESKESIVDSRKKPDFYADNIRVSEGRITFDFHTPEEVIADIRLGVPVWVNIENATAAMSVAWLVGKDERREAKGESQKVLPSTPVKDKNQELKDAMASFKGVWRRFNIHVNTPKVVYVDDYAHHPQEIATAIDSVRKLYPTRKLIGVFQPHLYTRTRDFASDFARVLHTMDELVLLPIYPARELPIPGVTSEMLGGKVVAKSDLVSELKQRVAQANQPVVILTVGAGDIDRLVPEVAQAFAE